MDRRHAEGKEKGIRGREGGLGYLRTMFHYFESLHHKPIYHVSVNSLLRKHPFISAQRKFVLLNQQVGLFPFSANMCFLELAYFLGSNPLKVLKV